ncbi:MAG: BrnA antitoxin family protein [Sphingomonadales bacterium]|nr:BrnA antitoxin family protein [Sphingomonadaceae bacterium]MBS3932524.1 BrnA antitoxin family protein [Sphingomonadales bacterium]
MTMNDRNLKKPVGGLDEIKPELDDDWFAEADAYVGTKLVRRGRPRVANPKKPVSLRLDSDVIDWFKRSGEGWQTRINDELRKAAGL